MEGKDCYKIEYLTDGIVVVFSTAYINPIAYLSKIEEDLRDIKFDGQVIFDLLLSNGYSSNRFVQATVKDSQINKSSIKILKTVDSLLLKKSHDFYSKNRKFVENSILGEQEQKELLTRAKC